jgi:glycosyltransferase involved in cell wall biosynthesis
VISAASSGLAESKSPPAPKISSRFTLLHVIDGMGRGGAERMLVELANAAMAAGHDVHCCITRQDRTLAEELDPRVNVHVLGRSRRFDIGALLRFASLQRSIRPSLLHVHSRSTLSFVAATRVAGAPAIPVVFHDHYGGIVWDRSIPLWFPLAARWIVTEYVGVSELLVSWARSAGIPASRSRVIANALDFKRLDEVAVRREHTHQSPASAICIAGIRSDKGIDVLIRALALVSSHGIAMTVALVGKVQDEEYWKDCQRLAEANGVKQRLVFVGERADAIELTASHEVGIVPSRSESGPLVLIEMLGAGLPVAASRTGEVAESAVAAGVEGIVAAGDAVALAAEITSLAEMTPTQRTERGVRGRRIAKDLFDLRRRMEQWEEVYMRAVSK